MKTRAGQKIRLTSVEELLGVSTKAGELTVRPRLPASWNGCRLHCRAGGREHEITIRRGSEGWETEVRKSEKT